MATGMTATATAEKPREGVVEERGVKTVIRVVSSAYNAERGEWSGEMVDKYLTDLIYSGWKLFHVQNLGLVESGAWRMQWTLVKQ